MQAGIRAHFQCKRFGKVEDTLRLVFANVTTAQHDILSAYTDVVSFPANLNAEIGTALTVVQNRMKALGIPSKRVTSTTRWVQLIRGILNHTESLKLLNKDNVVELVAANMDTQFQNLSQTIQDKITTFLTNHNIDLSIAATDTVEDILQDLADTITVIHKIFGVPLQ